MWHPFLGFSSFGDKGTGAREAEKCAPSYMVSDQKCDAIVMYNKKYKLGLPFPGHSS